MPAPTPTRIPPSGDFAGKAWQQVLARDPAGDGQFVYAVRSTKIFCKPSCASRKPTRRNVSFFTRALDRILGVTPSQYARSHRLNAFRESLQPRPASPSILPGSSLKSDATARPSITDALYAAGFGSSSRLYESSADTLGMTPSTLRSGGAPRTPSRKLSGLMMASRL